MAVNQTSALEVEQLSVVYDRVPVLWDLHLSIPKGTVVGILGPNGAGKSTFLKALLGIVKPISGKVRFLQEPYEKARKSIAYVSQRNAVDWDFPVSVRDVVSMGCYGRRGLFRGLKKEDHDLVEEALRQLGLEALGDRQIKDLSGGQQQKTFIARAIVQRANLYFLDEPFAGVDITTEKTIIEVLKGLREQDKTIFVVHHDLHCVREYFDYIVLLNTTLIASGPVNEVFSKENLLKAYGEHLFFSDFTDV